MKNFRFEWVTYKDGKKDKTYDCIHYQSSEEHITLTVYLNGVRIGSDEISAQSKRMDYNDQITIEEAVRKIINRGATYGS